MISDPGDSVFHYGPQWPPTVEEYIELLRTEWADHIFVFAGGADPGGSLHLYEPLSLDTYSETLFQCPPLVTMPLGFLLMRDYYPLGAVPYGCCGDETIPWPDSMHYPLGYPIDGNAYREEQYALWDLTVYGYVDDICENEDFSMRVRVTDHVGNWKRSGMIEDMQIGVPGVDENEVQVVSLHAVDDSLHYSWLYGGTAPENIPQGEKGEASIIHLRDIFGQVNLTYVAKVSAVNDPPAVITGHAASTELNAPEDCDVVCNLTFFLIDPENPDNQQLIIDLIDLLGELPVCGFFYGALLQIQDTATNGMDDRLFVSSRDIEYANGICDDHTFIAANPADNIDFLAYHQNLTYGRRRGVGYTSATPFGDEFENAYWYNYERMIKTSGFEVVYASIQNKGLFLPVQSQADLIYIGSHGFTPPETDYHVPEVGDFTYQGQSGQNDGELIGFGTLDWISDDNIQFFNDFIQEDEWDEWELFKAQEYVLPAYSDPAWLILDGCGQLNNALLPRALISSRNAWRDKLFPLEEGSPGSPPPLSSIAGYDTSINSVRDGLFDWNNCSYFLKYCASTFSSYLSAGPVAHPEYYVSPAHYGPITASKDNWVVDAWLASHIVKVNNKRIRLGVAQIVDASCSISATHDWEVIEINPSAWHYFLLKKRSFMIQMTN